jgi:hypothetical protein
MLMPQAWCRHTACAAGVRFPHGACTMRSWLFLCCLSAICGTSSRVHAGAQIGTALDIDLCLSATVGNRLQLVDCLGHPADSHLWVAWDWRASLHQVPLVGPLCMSGDLGGCVGADLVLSGSEEASSLQWSWDVTSMRIRLSGKCLMAIRAGGDLPSVQLRDCDWRNNFDEQSQEGPANQSWMLLPESRPQVDVLAKLSLPLRTRGRYIIDSAGKPVKLVGINWIGAHMEQLVNNGLHLTTAKKIAARILRMGFNSVRLGYALNVTDHSSGVFTPVPDPSLVAGDPSLANLSALEVFDACVEALTDANLLVIVNVHMSDARWCCSVDDNNGLWFNDVYSEEAWLESLRFLAARYRGNPRVIGYDIRNEPRIDVIHRSVAVWGVWAPAARAVAPLLALEDWRVGAGKGAVATWTGNQDALVIVEGVWFAMRLNNVLSRPMKLAQSCLFSRVVYQNHDYWYFDFSVQGWYDNPWSALWASVASFVMTGSVSPSTEEFSSFRDVRIPLFLFLHADDRAPVLSGEFGIKYRNFSYWRNIIRLYKEEDTSWFYWSVDAMAAPPGLSSTYPEGKPEIYGLFDYTIPDYKVVVAWKLQDLMPAMGTGPDFPSSLAAPEVCYFDWAANVVSVTEPTTLARMLLTANWMFWLTLLLLVLMSVYLCRRLRRCCLEPPGTSPYTTLCPSGRELEFGADPFSPMERQCDLGLSRYGSWTSSSCSSSSSFS